MKPNRTKCSALKFALLLGTISTLVTGCISYRGGDSYQHDHRDQSRFDEPKPDDFEHHQ